MMTTDRSLIATTPLFRNKRFVLNEMLQRNASKFAIFYVYENLPSFFHFSFHATLLFPYSCLVLVYVDHGVTVSD